VEWPQLPVVGRPRVVLGRRELAQAEAVPRPEPVRAVGPPVERLGREQVRPGRPGAAGRPGAVRVRQPVAGLQAVQARQPVAARPVLPAVLVAVESPAIRTRPASVDRPAAPSGAVPEAGAGGRAGGQPGAADRRVALPEVRVVDRPGAAPAVRVAGLLEPPAGRAAGLPGVAALPELWLAGRRAAERPGVARPQLAGRRRARQAAAPQVLPGAVQVAGRPGAAQRRVAGRQAPRGEAAAAG
jgi:hypothetical protein